MRIEIAYAEPSQQWLLVREVAEGTTLAHVMDDAEVREWMQRVEAPVVGVWSKIISEPTEHVLVDGDRIEIYRPLSIDPMAARKARAEKAKNAR